MTWLLFTPALLTLTTLLAALYAGFVRKPAQPPESFKGRERPDEPVVVCIGCSLTHATLSGDFVAMLRARRPDMRILNAGKNGDTARGLNERLRSIEACDPDAVVVLIGTNDVRIDDDVMRFSGPLEATLTALRSKRVAVLSIPPLSEERDGAMNRRIERWNAEVRTRAAQAGAEYLPLFEELYAQLPDRAEGYRLRISMLIGSALRRYVLRQSWDQIAAARGLRFLTDQIHLSDAGARVVATLVGDWLDRALPPKGTLRMEPSTSRSRPGR
jgi:acyl-CoA thioesterase I